MEEPIETTVNNHIRKDVYYIPPSDQVDYHIKPEDIQTDLGEIVYPETDAHVLGTTYRKPKSKLTRFTRKIGKLLRIIPKKNKTTHTHLDFDTTLVEKTCLRDVVLTDIDIAVLKPVFDTYREENHISLSELREQMLLYFGDRIAIYCVVRRKMIERDPEFLEKYQRLSIYYLYSILTKPVSFLYTTLIDELGFTLSKTDSRLKDENLIINKPETVHIEEFLNSMNRTLYREGDGAEFLGKRGGKKRTKRYKKNRRSKKCRK